MTVVAFVNSVVHISGTLKGCLSFPRLVIRGIIIVSGWGVVLPYPSRFALEFVGLYQNARFLKDIRAYNSMFFFITSFRVNVNEGVNDNRGPYVFKISVHIFHRIGSLSPDLVKGHWFLKLDLFDTEHKVENRFRAFDGPTKRDLDSNIVQFLVSFLGANNEYMRTFKTAKLMADETNLQFYAVRLFNNVIDRRYELPSLDHWVA